MTTFAHPSITLKNRSILNCFGIQPIFVNDGYIKESFQAFVYRVGTIWNLTGKMHQLHSYRIGDENKPILKNAFHIKNADKEVVNFLLNQRTFTFKQNASLDELMDIKNKAKLKELILMHFERIKYYTMMCQGNFIITSRQDLYNRKLFASSEVYNHEVYLVDKSILPQNVLILGHHNTDVFRSPYVACPLIDEKHFNEICELNGINLKDIGFNKDLRYPLIDKYVSLYTLYQSYLDNVDVPYWYIEDFGNPVKTRQKAYYTTLFFD